jgi:hypothetical protein
VPTDVTNAFPDINVDVANLNIDVGANSNISTMTSLSGVTELKAFPLVDSLGGPLDFLVVNAMEGAVYTKETPYLASLTKGSLLVSCKRPSIMGMVKTPLGLIAFSANTDAIITFNDGVLKVLNLDGLGNSLKINLSEGPFGGAADPVFGIAPGYELTAADHKLTRNDLRPVDGVSRRKPRVLENGLVAVSEFRVDSLLQNNALTTSLAQKTDSKERRIVSDISRMAAVLNHVNGTEGYSNK